MPAQKTVARKTASKRASKKAVTVSSPGMTNRFNSKIALPVIGIFAIIAAALMWHSFAATAIPAGFVYRSGSKLMLNGAPYKFVGYDAFGMFGCEGSAWSRTQMDNYFAALPPASMTRIWASHLYGTAMLDQAVASAEAHNQKLVMTLDNDTGDCVDDKAKTASWYSSGYKTGTYLGWVTTAVTKYKNSPAIGMWEVINEAGQTENSQVLNGTTMQNFYQDVASRIKAIDSTHLVSTGDNGDNNYIGGTTGWKTAGGAAAIDVLSIHDYASDYGGAGVLSPSWAGEKAAADSLSKPVMIGEINDSACNTAKTTRAANVKKSIDGYLTGGAAGVLVWNYSQQYYSQCPGEDYIITPSDPLYPMIKNYSIPGVVAIPPTTPIATPTPAPTPTPTPTPTPKPTPAPTPTPPISSVDKTAPTTPGSFTASRVTKASITISWKASTDAVGVKGYRVYRGSQKIADQSGTSLIINGLKSGTKYTFTVQAYDAAGNTSGKAQVAATTLGQRHWWW
jgi:hypothetical protein